jgi:putative transposase
MPGGDADYSRRWRWIKGAFTERWRSEGGPESSRSGSRVRSGEYGVWQRRFWEHLIRDETDLERHVDYIHYNPVKHGYAVRAADWPWSSFGRHVRLGRYPIDWGATEPTAPVVKPRE